MKATERIIRKAQEFSTVGKYMTRLLAIVIAFKIIYNEANTCNICNKEVYQ